MNNISNLDLKAPETVTNSGLKAWKVIMKFLLQKELGYTGGCKAFYGGEEAKKYHEWNLSEAALVVHYDGGDLRYCFNRDWDTPRLVDELEALLGEAGFYVERLTNWAAAIYKK